MSMIFAKLSRRRASTGVVLAAIVAAVAPAIGQDESPPPPSQSIESPAVSQQQSQSTPELSQKQLQKQQKQQQRLQQKQQRQAAGLATPAGPSMKDLFAGTLAAVVQASGGALLTGVAQVLTGRLVDWFGHKVAPAPDPGQAALEAPSPDGSAASLQSSGSVAPESVAAGLAFEVHRLDPGGATLLVDPSVHEFRTGERFVVFFRPSLPGRMDIYNINPAGQQNLIDTQELAAGQLTRLGPYEFTATTGDEQLRLVMQPCTTPQLVSATRDIVRVSDTAPGESGIALQACNISATRSARALPTRDIRKVTVEDGTRFALDPLTAEELASGQVSPREVTIGFRHF